MQAAPTVASWSVDDRLLLPALTDHPRSTRAIAGSLGIGITADLLRPNLDQLVSEGAAVWSEPDSYRLPRIDDEVDHYGDVTFNPGYDEVADAA